ncbi:MAG: periplasmic binding protein [Paenibacillus sp.]|nr:periplasmic binding protein [Paenibacillus sp.]
MRALQMILVLFLAIAVTACGQSSPTSGGSTTNGSQPADSAKKPDPAATYGERTIKHAMGSVTLKKKPERIVVLYSGAVDNIVSLGVKPVGAVESWDQKPWYNFLRAQMEGVKNLGEETQPNMEAIIALKPDLIIAQKSRHEKIVPQLNSIAPTIVDEVLYDWKANLKTMSEALDKPTEAAKIFSDWDKRVAEFKQKVGSKLANTEVSVMRFEDDGSARIYITGFAGTIFNELGLSRPKAQQVEGKTVINLTSKEQMSQLDGDYIFDITQLGSDKDKEKTKNEWMSSPLWKGLKGVKANKYFTVDVVTWNLSAGASAAKSLLDDLYKYFEIK